MVEEEIRSTLPQNPRNLSNSDPQGVQHIQPEPWVLDSASTWPFPPQVRSSSEPSANNPTSLPNDVLRNETLILPHNEIPHEFRGGERRLETLDDTNHNLSENLSSLPSLPSVIFNPVPIPSAPNESNQYDEPSMQGNTVSGPSNTGELLTSHTAGGPPEWSHISNSQSNNLTTLSPEVLSIYQRYNKESLRRCLKNLLSTDWLPHDKAQTFPLRDYCVNLNFYKQFKHVLQDKLKLLSGLCELLGPINIDLGSVSILLIGHGGSGKSCTLARWAMDWAEDKAPPEIQQFDFLFLINLRDVENDIPLEEIVVNQHRRFQARKVPRTDIKAILQGSTGSQVLLLFDGYDEYQQGINIHVDTAICSTVGDCSLILTSVSGMYLKKEDRDQFDAEIFIGGLSEDNIRICAYRYLQNESRCEELIQRCKQSGIYALLRNPLSLFIVSILHKTPEFQTVTHTEMVWSIIQLWMNRSRLKHGITEPVELYELYVLGELTWQAIQGPLTTAIIKMVEVLKTKPSILNLGLQQRIHDSTGASLKETQELLMFPQRVFQDFVGGFFINHECKFQIERIFKSWTDIEKHWNIVNVACGMLKDGQIIVQHVCEKFTEMWFTRLREKRLHGLGEWCLAPLIEIALEIQERCIDPLRNEHFNYITTLPLEIPSKMYVFGQRCSSIPCAVEVTENCRELELDTYSVIIDSPHLKGNDVLEAVCNLKQTIVDLFICNFNISTDDPAGGRELTFRLNCGLKSVIMCRTVLPPTLQRHLGMKLSSCHELKVLEIPGMEFIAQTVIKSLGLFEHLQYLDVGYCHLKQEKCGIVALQARCLKYLNHISLSRNCLGSHGACLLAASIKSWAPGHPLQELLLVDCKIGVPGSVELLDTLQGCNQLLKLDISENPLSVSFKNISIQPDIVYPKLHSLGLGSSSLSGTDLLALSHTIKRHSMPSLKQLEVGYKALKEILDIHHNKCPSDEFYCNILGELRNTLVADADEVLEARKIIADNIENVWLAEGRFTVFKQKIIQFIVEEDQRGRRRRIVEELSRHFEMLHLGSSLKSAKKKDT